MQGSRKQKSCLNHRRREKTQNRRYRWHYRAQQKPRQNACSAWDRALWQQSGPQAEWEPHQSGHRSHPKPLRKVHTIKPRQNGKKNARRRFLNRWGKPQAGRMDLLPNFHGLEDNRRGGDYAAQVGAIAALRKGQKTSQSPKPRPTCRRTIQQRCRTKEGEQRRYKKKVAQKENKSG